MQGEDGVDIMDMDMKVESDNVSVESGTLKVESVEVVGIEEKDKVPFIYSSLFLNILNENLFNII